MKKIFAASLVAIMAVTAANADIASVGYVDGVVDALVSTTSGSGNVVTSVTQTDGKVVVEKEFTAASNAALDTLAGRVTAAEGKLTGLTSGDASVDKKIEAAVSTLETKTDAAAKLEDAKDYADGLASNYDAAGTAAGLVNALKTTEVQANTTAINNLKSDVETNYAKTTAVTSAIATATKNLATKGTTLEHYGITDASTTAEMNAAIANAKSEAISTAADDATAKANAAKEDAIKAIGTANFVIKKNGTDTGTIFNANANENVQLNLDLGSLATKSKVEEADLATALATKINGKQDAALVGSSEGVKNKDEQYPSVAYTESLINASKTDLAASKQDKFEAGNFLEFTTDSQGNSFLETTYTGETNVVTISNAGQIGVATSGITTAKIANDAVTTDKIKDDAVTTDKIKDDAVTTDKIKEGAIKSQHFDITTACAAGATCALVIKDGVWSWQTVQGLSAGN